MPLGEHFTGASESHVIHVLVCVPPHLPVQGKAIYVAFETKESAYNDLEDQVHRECLERFHVSFIDRYPAKASERRNCERSDYPSDHGLVEHQKRLMAQEIAAKRSKEERLIHPAWLFDEYFAGAGHKAIYLAFMMEPVERQVTHVKVMSKVI